MGLAAFSPIPRRVDRAQLGDLGPKWNPMGKQNRGHRAKRRNNDARNINLGEDRGKGID